ncbi:MAG: methylmalonyl Co-A mutase-associated GTPase MeaB [Deltaproteobacteria bacterium]|nr:methylmalonyl Co-A mutase-associated GTPase MeaB [Deltaproteobacteria bacterium]MBT4644080.1 methylmalonyl Co-A mutase-associated GTPase MeaB [Deltaproteobacteria bacterium]MBT6504041.1 methylmalonyl Co-A mutase-associated GTPase MeaB [Deltaproteobacteria bacterium]MBT7153548.1 methylmalonyl Co-A mutase-associated GTPase MeaB [Deltaproteobacteria bacterium]MBT7892696.1 methylmalonyl Co-A mutase-associated GTPase MeaB [Deltaproteobacteria bacterium]
MSCFTAWTLNSFLKGIQVIKQQKKTDGIPTPKSPRRKNLTPEEYIQGVLDNDRTVLARTITLIESNARHHLELAQGVLKAILPHTGNAIRVGITGVPGAGKSTFIDTLGMMLCHKGLRVAVLAVDPSSSLSRGSIMGDKTRMENLSQQASCYVRPSPSGGALGGVARKTRETMLVCEAAGFDVILVETVGVGQSESMVSTMVDFFLLLTLTGAGDELQNIKKGVIELADAILINKADGDNKLAAQRVRSEFDQALHYLSSVTEGWETSAYCCSALTGEGIEEIWDVIQSFKQQTQLSGQFQKRRQQQSLNWLDEMVIEQIKTNFYGNPQIQVIRDDIERKVSAGELPVTTAADLLLQKFYKSREGLE